jgi:hypothetical protein
MPDIDKVWTRYELCTDLVLPGMTRYVLGMSQLCTRYEPCIDQVWIGCGLCVLYMNKYGLGKLYTIYGARYRPDIDLEWHRHVTRYGLDIDQVWPRYESSTDTDHVWIGYRSVMNQI